MDFVYVGDNANTRYHLYPLRTDVVGEKPVQFAHVLHTKKELCQGGDGRKFVCVQYPMLSRNLLAGT